MGVYSVIERLPSGQLAVNIPVQILPPAKIQLVEEIIEVPGFLAQTPVADYPLIVRKYRDRLALSLTYEEGVNPVTAMTELGLDPWQEIWIRPRNTRRWIRASRFHALKAGKRAFGRVWMPREIQRQTKMYTYELYPAQIRGTTLPETKTRKVEKKVREVLVRHFGKTYQAERLAINQWRWIIPENIESYPVLKHAFEKRVAPAGESHLAPDNIINIDFVFSSVGGKFISKNMGYAYRNIALRNYSAEPSPDDYPFLCEIRASLITTCPKEFYQDEERYMRMMDALRITVKNMLLFFLPSIRHAEKQDKVGYETEGEEEQVKVSYGETEEFRYYHVEKYVRVINEQSYKRGEGEYIYLNDRIEADLRTNPLVDVDSSGFIWIRK